MYGYLQNPPTRHLDYSFQFLRLVLPKYRQYPNIPRCIRWMRMSLLSFSVLHILSCLKPLSFLQLLCIACFHVLDVWIICLEAAVRASLCHPCSGGVSFPLMSIWCALPWCPGRISSFGLLSVSVKVHLHAHSFFIWKQYHSHEKHGAFTVSKHHYLIIITDFCPCVKVYLCVHFFGISNKELCEIV